MMDGKNTKIALFNLFMFALTTLSYIGCSSSSNPVSVPTVHSSDHISNVNKLTSVLPANTRGAIAVDIKGLLAGNTYSAVTALLNGDGTDAALNEPFSAITTHSSGIEIQKYMDTALLAQTTSAQDGMILIAKLNRENLAEVINLTSLVEEPDYKTYEVYSASSSGLNITMLPDGLFVAGKSDSVKSVIDVYAGDAVNAAAGAEVGAYINPLAGSHHVTIAYGLPGMYKTVTTGLTLNDSEAISIWLDFSFGKLLGEASFYTSKAEDFASIYNEETAGNEQPPADTLPAEDGREKSLVISIPESDINKSAEDIIASRHDLKVLFFMMEARDNWTGIATSVGEVWKNFFVESNPPSVYVNYVIPDSQAAALSAAILPAGFELMKLRILESDTPAYFTSFNYYQASGIAAGARFEFNIMIKDPVQDKPRFFVSHALANGMSLDPVNGYTMAEPVTYSFNGSQLISEALQDTDGDTVKDDNYFSVTIAWPQASPQYNSLTREYVTANDYLFWGGGVCDRGLYTGSVHNRDVIVIPPGDYDVSNDTWLAPYLEPTPHSVVIVQNELDILLSPWWNLDADYLGIDESWRQYLITEKQTTYDWMIGMDINNMFLGLEDVITPFDASNDIPSVYFNYIVPELDATAFEATLRLPAGYTLEKTKILESDLQEEYYLTLNVYNINESIEGTRAEWSVYVDDGGGREHFMIIDLMTPDAVLDPVNLLNLPDVVEHSLDGSQLSTTLASSTIQFNATLDVTDSIEELHTLDWVEAKDFVCYINAICDKNYFGEGSLETPLLKVNPESVTVSAVTPWSEFIGSEPASILLRANKQQFAKKAWYNVQPLNP